ncbi:MAG: DUF389 domain-containing protein [Actinomycetota bacterium]
MAATDTPETQAAAEAAVEADAPFGRARRSWWHRHLDPQERRRVMTDLAIYRVEHWATRFVVMLTLSIIVAVMGLELNSAAVVIGAMLLAPLMQPVLAAGACLSMALFTKSMIALGKVTLATGWCIAIAYGLSVVLPDTPLTAEVLARTQPDIKDLVVALAAGAAGAYATVQEDVSASLPGVAVAVALVPPLGSVGIALESGDGTLAFGAFLLYITNLAAILFASIVVFVVTGFVPPRRLSDNLLRLTTAGVALVAIVVVIAVPLYQASLQSIEWNDEQRDAETIVDEWLGETRNGLEATVTIRRNDAQVVVDLRGIATPPDQGELLVAMRQRFPDYDVPVQWFRTQQATTTTIAPPEPTEQLLVQLRAEVVAWLDGTGVTYQLDGVSLDGSLVRIDAAIIGEPPNLDDLLPRLSAIDPSLQPVLNWVELATITEETVPTPLELTREELRAVVEAWAAERDLVVRSFDYDGERIEVEVAGSQEPVLIRLELAILGVLGEEVPLTVYFTERYVVTTTLPPEVTVITQ